MYDIYSTIFANQNLVLHTFYYFTVRQFQPSIDPILLKHLRLYNYCTMSKKQVLIECVCALLILLFLYASVSKFLDFKTFIDQMNNQPLPNSWTPFLVWAIPLLEIGISITLLFEYTRLLGLYASLFLMIVFTIYTGIVLLHFFPYIPCSCGGVIQKLTWNQHLVLNLFYVGLCGLGIVLQRRKHSNSIFITNKHSLV